MTEDDLPGGENEDFASLFEQSQRSGRSDKFQIGDPVQGRLLQLGKDWAFLDIGSKGEATINVAELLDGDGQPTAKVGDVVEARVVQVGEAGIVVSRVLQKGREAKERLEQAHEMGMPVEGTVKGIIKGGLEVEVAGVRTFCPASQIALHFVEDQEIFVGQKFEFRITRFGDGGRNIVVSRRVILEEERKEQAVETRARLEEGLVLTGSVTSLREYGAFVDIGGIEGLLHVSEISHARVQRAADVLEVGQQVEVKVLKVEGDRISLSRKALEGDPWDRATEDFAEGSRHSGTVTRVQPFGAFVELVPGVEGLLHVSNMGDPRIRDARTALNEGDSVSVSVISLETGRNRIGLALTDVAGAAPADLGPGSVLTGLVERVESYGVFVRLPGPPQGGRPPRGLVPLEEMGDFRGDLRNQFPVGAEMKVIVLEPDDKGRMRLSRRGAADADERAKAAEFLSGQESSRGFGTLGDLLRGGGAGKSDKK